LSITMQENRLPQSIQETLKEAIAAYGIPNKLYVDNGSPYSNDQLSFICGSVGTVLLHTPVRDGASKGKVERNFRTLKERWLYGLDVSQIQGLKEFNREFCTLLGLEASGNKTGMFRAIQERVYYLYREKKQPLVLAIDEAQYLNYNILLCQFVYVWKFSNKCIKFPYNCFISCIDCGSLFSCIVIDNRFLLIS